MLKKTFQISANKIIKLSLNLTGSIAFYPTLIAIALFFLALFTLYVDEQSPGLLLGYEIPIKNIIYPDSARSLLGAIAGGMISLMVFSFSMVMVILSQISSNYSPRILPNLIGQRSQQLIMGFYIGTIAYTFVILTSIQSKIYAFGVPSLSIVVNSGLTLLCLGLFVLFINKISQDIQIGNIISHVYRDTLQALRYEVKNETYVPIHTLPDTKDWTVVYSPLSGYLNEINRRLFLRITRRLGVTVRMSVSVGQFVNRRDKLFLASRPLGKEEQEEVIYAFVFRHQEEIDQQHVYGFKHLTEIALKALSPGINDPGTAIQAIDRLTDLFVERLTISGYKILTDKHNKLRFMYEPLHYDDILYISVNAIREYGKEDLTVMLKLLILLQTILRNDTENQHTTMVMNLLHDLVEGFADGFNHETDRKVLAKKVNDMIQECSDHPRNAAIQAQLGALLSSGLA